MTKAQGVGCCTPSLRGVPLCLYEVKDREIQQNVCQRHGQGVVNHRSIAQTFKDLAKGSKSSPLCGAEFDTSLVFLLCFCHCLQVMSCADACLIAVIAGRCVENLSSLVLRKLDPSLDEAYHSPTHVLCLFSHVQTTCSTLFRPISPIQQTHVL